MKQFVGFCLCLSVVIVQATDAHACSLPDAYDPACPSVAEPELFFHGTPTEPGGPVIDSAMVEARLEPACDRLVLSVRVALQPIDLAANEVGLELTQDGVSWPRAGLPVQPMAGLEQAFSVGPDLDLTAPVQIVVVDHHGHRSPPVVVIPSAAAARVALFGSDSESCNDTAGCTSTRAGPGLWVLAGAALVRRRRSRAQVDSVAQAHV